MCPRWAGVQEARMLQFRCWCKELLWRLRGSLCCSVITAGSHWDQPRGCLGQPWSSGRQCPAEARLFAGAQQEQAAGADTTGDTAPFPACARAQDSAATLVPCVPGFSKPFSGCWRPSAPGNPGRCMQTLGLRCSGMPAGRAACGGGSATQLSSGIPRAAGSELGLLGVSLAPPAALGASRSSGAAARCGPGQAGSWPISSSDAARSLPAQVHVSPGNVTGVRGAGGGGSPEPPRSTPVSPQLHNIIIS